MPASLGQQARDDLAAIVKARQELDLVLVHWKDGVEHFAARRHERVTPTAKMPAIRFLMRFQERQKLLLGVLRIDSDLIDADLAPISSVASAVDHKSKPEAIAIEWLLAQ